MVYDLILDCLFEENVVGALRTLGAGRLLMDQEDPEAPFLTDETVGVEAWEDCLVVRVRDRDPYVFARELERRVPQMRIVTVVDRTPKT